MAIHREKCIQISRRSFMRRVSATAAATGLPLWFVERELANAAEPTKAIKSPNERPNIALIGCGGMGTGDARNSKRYANLVAVCDVDKSHIDKAAWKDEFVLHAELFQQLAYHLPPVLLETKSALEQRLTA